MLDGHHGWMDSLIWAWIPFGLSGARIPEMATYRNHTIFRTNTMANLLRLSGLFERRVVVG